MAEHSDRNPQGRSAGARERSGVRDLAHAGFRYAFSLSHHREDAEDLVQQACLQVIRAKGHIASKTYLFVAIRNLFYDGGRRQALASFSPLDDAAALRATSDADQVDNRLDVEAVLSTLPVETRELIYLNCIEGFTAQEIADVTQRPRGTILSQLARAKHELKERFQAEREERALP